MAGSHAFDGPQNTALRRYFEFHHNGKPGGVQLPREERVIKCLSFVKASDAGAADSCKTELIDELELELDTIQLDTLNDRRSKVDQMKKDVLGEDHFQFTAGKQGQHLGAFITATRPELAALMAGVERMFQAGKHEAEAEEANQSVSNTLADLLRECAQLAAVAPALPVANTSNGVPQPRTTDNPLLRRTASQSKPSENSKEQASEGLARKRPLEGADHELRATARRWGELNYSRPGTDGSSEPPHQPEGPDAERHLENRNTKKHAWASVARGGPPLADISNNEGATDDRHTSEEDDVQVVRGFQTARAKLVSDYKKKGQNLPSFAPQNNSSNQVGMAPRTGLARRARGGGSMLGGKGGAAGAGSVRSGFVPPFVQKAMDGPGEENEGPYSERVMSLLAGPDGDLPEEITKLDPKMVEMVCNEIVDSSGSVKWDDIAGQDAAKRLVQELVVWPILNPQLFKGARAPPRGLLLFGPPGTGKTLIGKAIASNMDATFFSISASSLTSKWIGEGEKMVRALFAVAGCLQPSVIFIDEIDSILSARKSEGEHEASRRMKTEMLIQMEGCDPNSSSRRLLIIGATNRPEELDEAARRRLPKQLYIPLPCAAARRHMILRQLGPGGTVRANLSEADLEKLVSKTDGYSGSDMRCLIQEACQGPVRDAVKAHGSALAHLSEDDLRPVTIKDFQMAAKVQKASVAPAEVERYEQYNLVHGARYVDPNAPEAADGAVDDEDDW